MKRLDAKESETLELRDRIDELLIQNNKLLNEKTSLERTVSSLNETRLNQKTEINKFVEDNQKLVRLTNENEKSIKALETEKLKMIAKNEELLFDLKNTNGKLKSKEENLNYTQKLLDESKASNSKLQNTLRDYENQIDLFRNDMANLNGNLKNEREARSDAEKTVDKLRATVNERDREINKLVNDLEDTRRTLNKTSDDRYVLEKESEKLKNHIFILTEQNEKVSFIKFNPYILTNIFFKYFQLYN